MKKLMLAALAVTVAIPTMPSVASAQDSYRNREYQGRSNRHYRCKGNDGAVGTVAGGAGGAVLGNVLGGGTLGTIAGGVGGALVGRHFDKKNTAKKQRERGC